MSPQRRALLERSWAGVFRKHLLEALPVQDLAKSLDVGFGRPSKDLHVALGCLILQQMFDLTDKAAVEALAFNLAWHYALDIRSERDCYFCEKTLRSYRALEPGAVTRDGPALADAAERLRDDHELVQDAVVQDGPALAPAA